MLNSPIRSNDIGDEVDEEFEEAEYEVSAPVSSKEEGILKLQQQRIIFLDNYLSQEFASFICASLIQMDSEDDEIPITMVINSPGGLVASALFPIVDTMMYTKAPIKTIAMGEAYSSAAVILSAGTPGMRSASPLSKIMIHGIAIDAIGGKENDIKLEAKILKEMNIQLMQLLARFCGQSLKRVKTNCSKDYYLSPKEAVKYGLIDEVLPYRKTIPDLKK